MLKRPSQLVVILMVLSDLVATALAPVAAFFLSFSTTLFGPAAASPPRLTQYLPSIALTLVLTFLVFSGFGLYRPRRTKSRLGESWDVVRAVFVVWLLTYVFTHLTRGEALSPRMMAVLLVIWPALIGVIRLVTRTGLRFLRRRGWNVRRAAIIGAGRLGQSLFHVLKRNAWTGVQPVFFADNDAPREKLLGLDVLGPLEKINELLTARPVDMAFVALPGQQRELMERLLSDLAATNVDVRVVPDLLSFHFLRRDVTQLDNLPIITLTHSPQHGWNSVLKRTFDLVFSAAALLLLALPMLVMALLVKLTSSGPVFYRQQRASISGRPFRIFKFRTMLPQSEHRTGPVWASRNDPRVTPIGRVLRRTSLDELPQLFNVLRGDMSLVGPRPERPELIERFRQQVPRYMLRQQVKAGLTGWAQVHGYRGRSSLRKRVQYDLYYITNWSFALDLWIILLTPLRGLIHPNAY